MLNASLWLDNIRISALEKHDKLEKKVVHKGQPHTLDQMKRNGYNWSRTTLKNCSLLFRHIKSLKITVILGTNLVN